MTLQPTILAEDFLPGLALALSIGLLIGIERGWTQRDHPSGERVAGLRTFSILGLLGGLAGLGVGGPLNGLSLLLAAAACIAILVGYWRESRRAGHLSATSAIAAVVTLALGAIATAGHPAIASVGAGATVILLASRKPLHRALSFTSEADLKALVRLVVVVLVILPLLPDTGLGPYELNPRRLWFVVVTCVAISFISYALSRWLGGRRGALITAGVGSMVSSTAVTLEVARRIRESGVTPASDAAIALGQAVMLARALILVIVLAPMILVALGKILVPAMLAGMLVAGLLFYRSKHASEDAEASTVKPPGLGLALLFALSVAAISTLAGWAGERLGAESAAAVIALGGVVDIDSAIASVGTLPRGTLEPRLAAYAIAAPVLFNTLFKLGIVVAVGGVRRISWGAASLFGTALVLVAMALANPL